MLNPLQDIVRAQLSRRSCGCACGQPSSLLPRRGAAKRGQRGVALVLVLLFLVLISGFTLAFFSSGTNESSAAVSAADGAAAKLLADSTISIVQAQIQDATKALEDSSKVTEITTWASQPGMIRTYTSSGEPDKYYKLYSDSTMVVDGDSFESDSDAILKTWSKEEMAEVYTDLNAPGADLTGELVYPIADPRAADLADSGPVEGFSLKKTPGFVSGKPEGPRNNKAPMPVEWLYVLKDGSFSPAEGSLEGAVVKDATADNPVVGRVAFWTDDESTKVNINTASEGIYWDVPRIYSREDFGMYTGGTQTISDPGYSVSQPALREFQRYPGHPATTSLSPIFGKIFPVTYPIKNPTLADTQLQPYYEMAPRTVHGGSMGGTKNPTTALTADSDRLYASVDELMFSTKLSSGQRVPQGSGTSPDPKKLTQQQLERRAFFLTANSSAPETTLYNTPRISIWPVNTDPKKRTPYDRLSAFCATTGVGSSALAYHITRSNSRSGTIDLTPRNERLYRYLQKLTDRNVPGFGGNFRAKFSAGPSGILDRDQLLTFMFDYIRCTSLQDKSSGATPFTQLFNGGTAPAGAGEVVPLRIDGTQGFGRFYSVSEADFLFYGTKGAAGRTTEMRALLLMEFASPMQGLGCMRSNMAYSVTGLESLEVQFNNGPWLPLTFAPSGTNYIENADLNSHHGRSVGGTEGPVQAITLSGGAPGSEKDVSAGTSVRGKYPFVTKDPVPVASFPPDIPPSFRLRSTARDKEIVIKVLTADTNYLVQTIRMQIPEGGEFKVPNVVGGSTYDFNSRVFTGGEKTFDLTLVEDTIVGLEPAGKKGNDPAGDADSTAGDTRMVEALIEVPSSRYRAHRQYMEKGVSKAHGLLSAVGEDFKGGVYGKLSNVSSYQQSTSYNLRQPDVSSRAPNGVTREDGGPGDWDTGFGDQKDGAYINKPDEGDTKFYETQGGNQRLPYLLGYGQGFASADPTYFAPTRQVPSSMMFGSLPTGVQRFLPWQTLLFHPRPEDPTHPGKKSPPDHLIADLFWMPVVEPYAISQPFATSGKINLNYEIQPFTYIRRDTGIRAVMKATKFLAIPPSDSTTYKPIDPGNNNARNADRRSTIDMNETLLAFEKKFADGDLFRSATEICDINLIKQGQSAANIATFWKANTLTGDNVREKPYVDLYPRLTTRSNSYTVHMRVQVLRKGRNTAPNLWKTGSDMVVSDYRGSAIVERYIDMNDKTLPDFATLAVQKPDAEELNIDRYYKMRVVSTKRFNP